MPSGAGLKENEKGRKRTRKTHREERSTAGFSERVPSVTPTIPPDEYQVVFVKDTKALTCYGCGSKLRNKPSDAPPPAPYDLMLKHHERRVYQKKGTIQLKVSRDPESVYYHVRKTCVLAKCDKILPRNITITEPINEQMSEVHKRHLSREFGVLV